MLLEDVTGYCQKPADLSHKAIPLHIMLHLILRLKVINKSKIIKGY